MVNEYDLAAPIVNKLLQPDNTVTTLSGNIPVSTSSQYDLTAPIANKVLQPDGSITTLDGIGLGASGGTVLWFSTTNDRDIYFTQNPDALKSGISVGVGNPVTAYTYDGDAWVTGALAFQGPQGPAGKQIEVSTDAGYIVWRYAGDVAWNNLVALSALKGADGREIILRGVGTVLQWQYDGDGAAWNNLIDFSGFEIAASISEYVSGANYSEGNVFFDGDTGILYVALDDFTSVSVEDDLAAGYIRQIGGGDAAEETDPVYTADKPSIAFKSDLPDLAPFATHSEVTGAVSDHNLSPTAHGDIRGEISDLEGRAGDAEGDISDLRGRMDDAESDISDLQDNKADIADFMPTATFYLDSNFTGAHRDGSIVYPYNTIDECTQYIHSNNIDDCHCIMKAGSDFSNDTVAFTGVSKVILEAPASEFVHLVKVGAVTVTGDVAQVAMIGLEILGNATTDIGGGTVTFKDCYLHGGVINTEGTDLQIAFIHCGSEGDVTIIGDGEGVVTMVTCESHPADIGDFSTLATLTINNPNMRLLVAESYLIAVNLVQGAGAMIRGTVCHPSNTTGDYAIRVDDNYTGAVDLQSGTALDLTTGERAPIYLGHSCTFSLGTFIYDKATSTLTGVNNTTGLMAGQLKVYMPQVGYSPRLRPDDTFGQRTVTDTNSTILDQLTGISDELVKRTVDANDRYLVSNGTIDAYGNKVSGGMSVDIRIEDEIIYDIDGVTPIGIDLVFKDKNGAEINRVPKSGQTSAGDGNATSIVFPAIVLASNWTAETDGTDTWYENIIQDNRINSTDTVLVYPGDTSAAEIIANTSITFVTVREGEFVLTAYALPDTDFDIRYAINKLFGNEGDNGSVSGINVINSDTVHWSGPDSAKEANVQVDGDAGLAAGVNGVTVDPEYKIPTAVNTTKLNGLPTNTVLQQALDGKQAIAPPGFGFSENNFDNEALTKLSSIPDPATIATQAWAQSKIPAGTAGYLATHSGVAGTFGTAVDPSLMNRVIVNPAAADSASLLNSILPYIPTNGAAATIIWWSGTASQFQDTPEVGASYTMFVNVWRGATAAKVRIFYGRTNSPEYVRNVSGISGGAGSWAGSWQQMATQDWATGQFDPRYVTVITGIDDLNNYLINGKYAINTADSATVANMPIATGGLLEVLHNAASDTISSRAGYQRFTAWTANRTFQRNYAGSNWSAWVEITTTLNSMQTLGAVTPSDPASLMNTLLALVPNNYMGVMGSITAANIAGMADLPPSFNTSYVLFFEVLRGTGTATVKISTAQRGSRFGGISGIGSSPVWQAWNYQETFSTTETMTDKIWIDGKAVYRRVFTGNITVAANIQNITNLTSSGIDSLVAYGGTVSDGSNLLQVGFVNSTSDHYAGLFLNPTAHSIRLQSQSAYARTNAPYQIWCEYTKT